MNQGRQDEIEEVASVAEGSHGSPKGQVANKDMKRRTAESQITKSMKVEKEEVQKQIDDKIKEMVSKSRREFQSSRIMRPIGKRETIKSKERLSKEREASLSRE